VGVAVGVALGVGVQVGVAVGVGVNVAVGVTVKVGVPSTPWSPAVGTLAIAKKLAIIIAKTARLRQRAGFWFLDP
jgi:hypothetical protein